MSEVPSPSEQSASSPSVPAEEATFRNDQIEVAITRRPGCQVHMQVTCSPAFVQERRKQAIANVRKEVTLPGFRKGKVPPAVIEKNYASAVLNELHDLVLPLAFSEAVHLSEYYPYRKEAITRSQIKRLSVEEGATAVFDFEMQPQPPTIDIQKIETRPTLPQPVTPKMVELAYRKHRMSRATMHPVEDRGVEVGDIVELDVDVIEYPAHNVCTNQRFSVVEEELSDWIYRAVLGMQLHESREVRSVPDKDEVETWQPYEPKLCRITLKAIYRAELPEEDEAMLRAKATIQEQLQHSELVYAQELSRYHLRQELLAKFPIDIPRGLVEDEVALRRAFCERARVNQEAGSLPMDDERKATMLAQIRAEAYAFLSCVFLLRPLFAHIDSGVTKLDILLEITHQAIYVPDTAKIVFDGLSNEAMRERVSLKILIDRVTDWLLEQVQESAPGSETT